MISTSSSGTISIRPLEKADLQVLNHWKNDESVYKYLGGGYQPVSIDQQEKWMDSMIDMTGSNRRFMIIDPDGAPAGMVGLYGINWIHRTCEIGVYIGEHSAMRKGYASEACRLVEGFARDYLNLRKIKLNVVSDNVAAISMWCKLGYSVVGEYKKERYIAGRYHDLKVMEKFLNERCY